MKSNKTHIVLDNVIHNDERYCTFLVYLFRVVISMMDRDLH